MDITKKVIFICRTCEFKNKMNNDIHYKVEFDSYTEAFEHLLKTHSYRDDSIHDMYAEVR